jgi:hypothetical protein
VATPRDLTPPGAVIISPKEVWSKLDRVSTRLLGIENLLKDVDKRLTALEKWKWAMLAIGLGGGTGASQIIERLMSG